ncbi:hypothetical protein BHM03_00053690, partial [Ensete ventricosum]
GNLVAKRSTFPSGIKSLSDYVHAKGLKLGIYSDAGSQTCSRTMPGSLGYEQHDARTFASWVCMLLFTLDVLAATHYLLVTYCIRLVVGRLSGGRVAVVLWNRGSSQATITARCFIAPTVHELLDLIPFPSLLAACDHRVCSRAARCYGGSSCLQDVRSDAAVEPTRLGAVVQTCAKPSLHQYSLHCAATI